MTHVERQRAAQVAIETLRKLGREDLLATITIEWNHRFTRRMGDAEYLAVRGKPVRAIVRLSSVLWDRATEDEQWQTVVHEVCHLVNRHEEMLDRRPAGEPHGAGWRAVMRRAGASPERCHRVDRTGIARKMTRYGATCGCSGKVFQLSAIRAAKMRKGHSYRCTTCGQLLKLGEEIS